MKKNILFITLCLLLSACAQIRNPTGGSKDTEPPVIVKSNPENLTTNLTNDQEIEITFDEFIKLSNLTQELIISPPIFPAPSITSKGKKLKIDLSSSILNENTTYSINLGDAVVDFNESNPYKNLTYVFSTGLSIDSLEIYGSLLDVQTGKKLSDVSVLLFSDLTDTFQTTNPNYLVRTDSSGHYHFQNLPPTEFSILAIQDKNKNKKIDYSELIGFSSSTIDLSSNTGYELETMRLFPFTTKSNIILKDTIYGPHKNKYIFNKTLENVPIYLKKNGLIYNKYTSIKDTLIVYPTKKTDKLKLFVNDSLYSSVTWDSITNKPIHNKYSILNAFSLHEKDTLELSFKYPKDSIELKNIQLFNDQNTQVNFNLTPLSSFKYGISADFIEDKNYTLVLKKSIIHPDSSNSTPDSINFNTLPNNTLGNLICVISNYNDSLNSKVLVLYKGDNPIKSKLVNNRNLRFNYLKPGIYTLKVINDTNNDGKWTTGSFEKKIHPERIIHFKNPIDIKENWDIEVNINL